jgi:intein/homing endonuclease
VWHHPDTVLELVTENGATVTTTEDHPFWNATDHAWEQADQLDPGDQLYTADGRTLQVRGLNAVTAHTTTSYNLTIRDIHTYYVLAGETPVLVHNNDCGLPEGYTSSPALKGDPYHPDTVGARSALNDEYYLGLTVNRADALGYSQRIPAQRVPFNSHGQAVYYNGKNYITPDVDAHNVTNGWKMFDMRGNRIGTYDMDLNYVKK